MSAENLAKDLLHEVQEEGLDAFLRSLHRRCGQISTTFGLHPLDRLLAIFRDDVNSQHQQNAQRNAAGDRYLHSDVPFEIPPPIVEITGIMPCSGKTQLLHFLIALALLPATLDNISLSGRDSAVVLLDLTNRFSILRLRDVMRDHIMARFKEADAQPPPNTAIRSTIHAALTHLHIFHPESTPSLLETLEFLPSYLLAESPSHLSASRPLGLVAISDSTAFLAQDRLDSESESTATTLPPPTTGTTAPRSLLETRHAAIVQHLDALRTKFSSPIILTSSAAPPSSSSSPNSNLALLSHPSVRPPLPVVYSTVRTMHLLVQRNKVAKFGPGMSVEEAHGEKAQRWDAVRRAGFGVSVNWWGSGAWSPEVRASLKNFAGGGGDVGRGGGGWQFWANGKDGEGGGFVHE